jgi:pseudouridine-5'-phosphate glycosidase
VRTTHENPRRDYLEIAPEVREAVRSGAPVVALESSVIAAGLPAPHNLAAARACEAAVRAEGAVPATIAIVNGKIRVGLDDAALSRLASAGAVEKASRRDLAYLLGTGRDGATTVAGTLVAARLAGIDVFATGGIGGVHRGWRDTLDVSADLEELPRANLAVVCSGAKSILDLPATLEVLETRGVPVIGFGTGAFPAFYARASGLKLVQRVELPEDAALILLAQRRLGLDGAVLFANPCPASVAIDADTLDGHVRDALAAAAQAGVRGKDVTPFLLARIAAATGGASLKANLALLENNARTAARIARAFVKLRG